MSDVLDFLAYCHERGLRLRAKGDKLLVSPKEKLLPEDADYIRANKAALIEEVRLMWPPCPGTCPGAANELCCGCPDVQVDYLLPDGRIVTSWCLTGADVSKATHRRQRGEKQWQPIQDEAAV